VPRTGASRNSISCEAATSEALDAWAPSPLSRVTKMPAVFTHATNSPCEPSGIARYVLTEVSMRHHMVAFAPRP
jgi:hypothetical protein